jgi:hypothetical protein
MQHSSSRAGSAWLVLAAALGVSSLARPARACSFLEVAIESSYPASGAVGVPTNVVLYVSGEQVVPDWLSLESATGERVATSIRRVLPTGFDVTPAIELEPNQHYLLVYPNIDSIGPSTVSIEFETGDGPAAPALLPPPELAGAVVLGATETACPYARLCLEPGGSGTALFAAHPEIQLSEWQASGTLGGLYGMAYVPDDCLQVWRRDALGNRSEVVELCGADVPSFAVSARAGLPSCQEFRHDLLAAANPDADAAADANPDADAAAAADAAGCSLAAPGTRASSGVCLGSVLALLAAVGVRRRRRAPALLRRRCCAGVVAPSASADEIAPGCG